MNQTEADQELPASSGGAPVAGPEQGIPRTPSTETPSPETPSSPVMRLLRWSLHAMLVFLVTFSALRLLLSDTTGWLMAAGLAGAAGILIGYALAVRQPNPTGRQMRWWLAGITTVWVALMVLSPDFAWVCFPLFFLHLHILARRHAMLAIAVMTFVVVVTLWLHAGKFSPGLVLGPLLGAIFSVVVGLAYSALHSESRARLQSLIELRRTQGELAASQREAGRLAEQERLAAEIHDTVAQGLASLVLLSRAAGRQLGQLAESSADRPADSELRQVSELVAQSEEVALSNLAEARRVVAGLAPPALDRRSVAEAMAAEVERHQQLSDVDSPGTEWVFRTEGEPTAALPESVAGVLLRAGQASWSNAFKHARAQKIVTTLTWLPDAIALDIVDNGIGFEAARSQTPLQTPNSLQTQSSRQAQSSLQTQSSRQAQSSRQTQSSLQTQSSVQEQGSKAASGGFGLDLTRARVQQAGGAFTVETTDTGTAVAISLPLGPNSAGSAASAAAVTAEQGGPSVPVSSEPSTAPTTSPSPGLAEPPQLAESPVHPDSGGHR